MKFFSLFFILFSSSVFASDVTGIVNSQGDLVINIIDRPSESPFDAAMLWTAVTGTDATKKIKSSNFSLTCATTVSQPLNERFGSCRLVLSKSKLNYGSGYFGGIVSDAAILNRMIDVNLSLASGKLIITVDHAQSAVGIKVDESLVN